MSNAFNQMIANILENVTAIEEKNKSLYEKRLERVKEAYSEANNGLLPNLDKIGRLHAPCNGYTVPQFSKFLEDAEDFEDNYKNALFSKGEFIPYPMSDDYDYFTMLGDRTKHYSFEFRIQVSEKEIEILESINCEDKPFSISFSRSWNFRNVKYSYVTISSFWKTVHYEFADNIQSYRQMIEEQERLEKERVRLERLAKKGKAPVGVDTVSGIVISFKNVFDGFGNIKTKMLVELENKSTVFGIRPARIKEVKEGDKVTFTATFDSTDDDTHAFYKSPKQVSFEEQVA